MKKIHLVSVTIFVLLLVYSCGSNSNQGDQDGQVSKPATPTGADIYNKTCITCHQAKGEGVPNTFPPLAKSDYLADKEKVIGQVIKGRSGELVVNGVKYNNIMPPQELSDDEIASVLSYVYGNFGNSGGTITPADVKATRAKLQ